MVVGNFIRTFTCIPFPSQNNHLSTIGRQVVIYIKNRNAVISILNEVCPQAGYKIKGVIKVARVIMLSLLIIFFNTQPGIQNESIRTKDWIFIY